MRSSSTIAVYSFASLLLTGIDSVHAQSYHAGAGLSLSGTTFSVANGGVTGTMIGLPLSLTASSSSPILTVTNSGSGYGIKTVSTSGTGTYGTNVKYGNVGTLGDINGFGVYGSTAAGPYPYGVFGINRTSGNGDYGILGGIDPIYKAPAGVFGSDPSSAGGNGVLGDSSKGSGVAGVSSSGIGVLGISTGSDGMQGQTSSNGNAGVAGVNNGSGNGVYGVSRSSGDYGFLGGTDPTYNVPAGVYGNDAADGGDGVSGSSSSNAGFGIAGSATGPSGAGVYGQFVSTNGSAGFAGRFSGNVWVDGGVSVSGTLTAGAKNFKIDHPLDPEHKYLYHASIESDKMENIYDGSVTTDGNGNATVTLPAWFDALNTDCHYQLTCIGQFAQAIVASKVQGNQFTIKTDRPNVEVSWQVTGIRHDAFALAHPMQVEQDKPEREQGLYQNPEAFGQPESMGTGYTHRHKSLRPAGGG